VRSIYVVRLVWVGAQGTEVLVTTGHTFYAPYGASLFRKRFAFRDDLFVKAQTFKFSRHSDPMYQVQ